MLQAEHLMQALEAAGADHNVIYVSVPITSGRREVALFDEIGVRDTDHVRREHNERWLAEVVGANEDEARADAARVRQSPWAVGSIVVDPSRMKVEGWAQDDYNGFWVELMRRHVRRVVATPGWAFSRGARTEVALALSLSLPVVGVEGEQHSPGDLIEEVRAARAELRGAGWSPAEVDLYLQPLSINSGPDLRPSAAERSVLVVGGPTPTTGCPVRCGTRRPPYVGEQPRRRRLLEIASRRVLVPRGETRAWHSGWSPRTREVRRDRLWLPRERDPTVWANRRRHERRRLRWLIPRVMTSSSSATARS